MLLKQGNIYFLIICLSSMPLCGIASAETTEWQREININEETIINEGDLIKVKPGATIRFINSKSKLNIMGQLSISGNDKKPVTLVIPNLLNKLTATSIQEKTLLRSDGNLAELEIYPYRVDTKEVVDELRAFRYQYAFVWTVLMGICFYLVLNRSTYW